MTHLAEMELIAAVSVESLRQMTGRMAERLGREPTLGEVAQGLAIAYGAARGTVASSSPAEDVAALAQFVELAANHASFCLHALREAGL